MLMSKKFVNCKISVINMVSKVGFIQDLMNNYVKMADEHSGPKVVKLIYQNVQLCAEPLKLFHPHILFVH